MQSLTPSHAWKILQVIVLCILCLFPLAQLRLLGQAIPPPPAHLNNLQCVVPELETPPATLSQNCANNSPTYIDDYRTPQHGVDRLPTTPKKTVLAKISEANSSLTTKP